MGLQTVYKRDYLDLYLTSDEELGILDTSYIEDYYGTDGQLTLYCEGTGGEFEIVMAESEGGGEAEHDYFTGTVSMWSMPASTYQVRGQVRDVQGNYTVLNSYYQMTGQNIQELKFKILAMLAAIRTTSIEAVAFVASLEAELFRHEVDPVVSKSSLESDMFDTELEPVAFKTTLEATP